MSMCCEPNIKDCQCYCHSKKHEEKRKNLQMSKKLKFNNTYDSGTMTILVGPEKIGPNKHKFVGVILEFDLVIYADSFKQAKEEIEDYGWLWLKNARKNKLPEEVLNRPAPKKYWLINEILVEEYKQKLIKRWNERIEEVKQGLDEEYGKNHNFTPNYEGIFEEIVDEVEAVIREV